MAHGYLDLVAEYRRLKAENNALHDELGHCKALTAHKHRCKRKGTVELKGGLVCAQHAKHSQCPGLEGTCKHRVTHVSDGHCHCWQH